MTRILDVPARHSRPWRGRGGRWAGAVGALPLLLALTSGVQPLAQGQNSAQQAPAQSGAAFRVAIDLVNVDVAVTDAEGRFVPGLRLDDFEVYEDGKRQDVSAFALVDLPTEVQAAARIEPIALPPEPDVRTNSIEDVGGRVYIVVLDDLHVQPVRSPRVQDVARRFIESYVAPGDLAAVVHTSGRLDASQDVTANRHLLLRAVDEFAGQGMRSSMLDRLEEYQGREPRESDRADLRMNQVVDPLSLIRADYARRMLQTLTNAGDLLAATPGRRKALLLVSEGVSYDLQPASLQTSSGLTTFTGGAFPDVLTELQQVIRAAAHANIAIYSIDPRGLAAPGEDMIDVTSLPDNPLLGITPEAFQKEIRQAQDSLRVLSDLTGGAASVGSNDLSPLLERMVADNSTYYMLGYRSNSARKDGRYRSIEVRVKRPGVRVRGRRGYVAGPSTTPSGVLTAALEPSALLRNALNSPLPVTGLPLRAFAASFKRATGASVAVGIEIDAAQFKFAEENGLHTDDVEVALVALDARGTFTVGDRYTVTLRLKPDTYESVREHGVRVLFRLDLPPGKFQLRAAAHETGRDAVGSLTYDLDVPDFDTAAPALSGLVLATPQARQRPTARPDPVFSQTLPFPPTTLRTFRAGDTITAFFEVYGAAQPTDLEVVTSIHRGNGPALVTKNEHASAAEITDGGGGVGFAIPISLAGLSSGPHVLRVEIRPRSGGTAVAREVPVEVIATRASPP